MTAPALRRPPTRGGSLVAPVLTGVAGVVAVGALRLRDPHESGSWGWCPFLAMTGQPCPGCGGLRAVNDLTHGDVSAALGSNALAVLFVGAMAVAWVVWLVRRLRGGTAAFWTLGTRTTAILAIVALAFGAVRLLPGLSALQP